MTKQPTKRTLSAKSGWTSLIFPLLLALSLWSTACSTAFAQDAEPDRLWLENFKPIYFLYGNPFTKIQFSFKTRMVKDIPIYFGYSQIMMWDLGISNPYFYDLNYNPVAWYRFSIDKIHNQWIDVIPWEHESNGRGIDGEHSWDRVGALYHQENNIGDNLKFYGDIKLWLPVNYNSSNADLAQYRGIWELNLTLARFIGSQLEFDDIRFRLYPGGPSFTNPLLGGQELTLRLNGLHKTFLPFLVLQLFHGYAEYLRDYQENHWQFRVGLGF